MGNGAQARDGERHDIRKRYIIFVSARGLFFFFFEQLIVTQHSKLEENVFFCLFPSSSFSFCYPWWGWPQAVLSNASFVMFRLFSYSTIFFFPCFFYFPPFLMFFFCFSSLELLPIMLHHSRVVCIIRFRCSKLFSIFLFLRSFALVICSISGFLVTVFRMLRSLFCPTPPLWSFTPSPSLLVARVSTYYLLLLLLYSPHIIQVSLRVVVYLC